MKTYFVYMMSDESKMIYVGVTNNLKYRVAQHKKKLVDGFTRRYNLHKLVHYEMFLDIHVAIVREKQIKGWLRAKKIALIVAKNSPWNDLAADWFNKGQTKVTRINAQSPARP